MTEACDGTAECEDLGEYDTVVASFAATFSWVDLLRLALGARARFVVRVPTWNPRGSIQLEDVPCRVTMTVEEGA